MREAKQKSKQSVWLLTMLTVMIVLSAYYLVSEPMVYNDLVNKNNVDISNVPATNTNQDTTSGEIITGGVVSDGIVTENVSAEKTDEYAEYIDKITAESSDAIVALKMEKSESRSKQIDNYYTMMQTNLSEEAISEIHSKIENLQVVDESEFILEKLIVADGYKDVVVFSSNGSVDVLLQADEISNNEAVKIIKLVSERLKIPAINVHIKTVS